jgi:sensor histidine kinase YesM
MERKRSGYVNLAAVGILALIVFAARMIFEYLLPFFSQGTGQSFFFTLRGMLSNYALTLLMLIADFMLVRTLVTYFSYGRSFLSRTLWELGGVIFIAFVAAILMQLTSSDYLVGDTLNRQLFFSFVVALFFNILVTVIIDLFSYLRWKRRRELATEVRLRSQANYQYQLLKAQLNPHFLFNSLNVLDYLIHEDQDRASDYVKKLSDVYRYQLSMESRQTVILEEELDFVMLYVGLIKERFGEALDVRIDVESKWLRSRIVPCSIQILIENAVKHNIVKVSEPLVVEVKVEQEHLVVSNRINLKIESGQHSVGMGLENINKQYRLLFNSPIIIDDLDGFFTVKIPLFI